MQGDPQRSDAVPLTHLRPSRSLAPPDGSRSVYLLSSPGPRVITGTASKQLCKSVRFFLCADTLQKSHSSCSCSSAGPETWGPLTRARIRSTAVPPALTTHSLSRSGNALRPQRCVTRNEQPCKHGEYLRA
ncbi:hypothetical protein AAFF_G00256810 [Aldrovandia affinis]|uniref:Uncharacterized protein n=1 Tax=Aldrovandia affinis TaxID=143900 RepID=A0AAD7WT34_9TELE|nr:hypothetical protein AAFF_G00256810 [Aldrovandia affinis]